MIKPKMLVVELWGLGDLIIATPFLRAAVARFDVTLLAKPHAAQLRPHLWPEVDVLTFQAPWTAFRHKYRLWEWPWHIIAQLRTRLADERFAVAVSARSDPRDHLLISLTGATCRLGFPYWGSHLFLTHPLVQADPAAHRYLYWRIAGAELGLQLPDLPPFEVAAAGHERSILVHTGAGQTIRSWPLERYLTICQRLRSAGYEVRIACDPGQQKWWDAAGESNVAVPESVDALLQLINCAGYFIGNDSGPGHLAAACGLPTFTIFGPQIPEWFAPLSDGSRWIEGKACPYRPCSDYCHFAVAHCLERVTEDEVWERLNQFLGPKPIRPRGSVGDQAVRGER